MTSTLYITGIGAVTPIGIGADNYWKNLTKQTIGIRDIPGAAEEGLPVTKAGQISDFNPKDYLSMKLVQDLEPFMQYAYIAAEEALFQSGLNANSERVGIVMGSALSGFNTISETGAKYAAAGKAAGPKFLTKAMGNIAAAQFAISHGTKGPSMTVSTACSSGGDAITLAAMMIESGMADAMIVMTGESCIYPTQIQSLAKTGALSKLGESRPFDVNRSGFVLGEGGGAIIIENETSIGTHNGTALCKLLGYANNNDAYNPVSPNPSGEGAAACMRLALQKAGIEPTDVDYINAHGTATHMGDIAETSAIHAVFGTHPVLVSSTKGATGHMMGAGGVTEVITCIKSIQDNLLPVNIGMTNQDPECDLHIVTEQTSDKMIKTAMSNALGFGGQNSCIIVGSP